MSFASREGYAVDNVTPKNGFICTLPSLSLPTMTSRWMELCADKKKRQQDAIPKDWIVTPPPEDRLNVVNFPRENGLLTQLELEITESDVEVLLEKLASAKWASVDVTRAFYKRAILAHQAVNCLTEIFVDAALERAANLDAHLAKTGQVVGPLHGLPISLKDQISIKGLETTMGYASWIGKYAEKDATLVEILYEQGAVPFVRTNLPQTVMWPETFNYVFGRTLNPYNRTLTPGGSSGGEAALIGMRGSVLGVGSDMGGSIRIPSAFNGLYSLRPSFNRVPYRGSLNSMEGQDSLPSVLGPLSTSLYGVKVFMKAVVDAKPWRKDPLAVNKPWNQAGYELEEHGGGKDLVFGLIWNDGNVVPHPPVIRALEITRKALLAAGHKVMDFKPHKHGELTTSARAIWASGSADDYASVVSALGEPLVNTMDPNQNAPISSKNRLFALDATLKTAFGLWQIQKRRRDLRQEYIDHWEATVAETGTGRPIDAIIVPVAPYAAPPHGKNSNTDYTLVWSVLDYPALAFPLTKVDETIDKPKSPHTFLSEEDKCNFELYDPAIFKDAPVGIQLIGRTCEEEALIGMGELVDRALKAQCKLQ